MSVSNARKFQKDARRCIRKSREIRRSESSGGLVQEEDTDYEGDRQQHNCPETNIDIRHCKEETWNCVRLNPSELETTGSANADAFRVVTDAKVMDTEASSPPESPVLRIAHHTILEHRRRQQEELLPMGVQRTDDRSSSIGGCLLTHKQTKSRSVDCPSSQCFIRLQEESFSKKRRMERSDNHGSDDDDEYVWQPMRGEKKRIARDRETHHTGFAVKHIEQYTGQRTAAKADVHLVTAASAVPCKMETRYEFVDQPVANDYCIQKEELGNDDDGDDDPMYPSRRMLKQEAEEGDFKSEPTVLGQVVHYRHPELQFCVSMKLPKDGTRLYVCGDALELGGSSNPYDVEDRGIEMEMSEHHNHYETPDFHTIRTQSPMEIVTYTYYLYHPKRGVVDVESQFFRSFEVPFPRFPYSDDQIRFCITDGRYNHQNVTIVRLASEIHGAVDQLEI